MTTQKKAKTPATRAKAKPDTGTARSQPAARGVRGKVQGEGDYASAREFNADERKFVESHDTEALGRAAAPRDAAEGAELEAAERKGQARAKPDPDAGGGRDENDADERDDDVEQGRS